jgi:hypothetical protein
MPIHYEIDRDQRLVIATPHAKLTDAELFDYQREVWSQPANLGYSELVDLSEVTDVAFISVAGISELARLSSSMDSAEPSKFAIVGKADLYFGLGRVYQFEREISAQSTKTVRVFRNREDALAWLGVRLPPVQT